MRVDLIKGNLKFLFKVSIAMLVTVLAMLTFSHAAGETISAISLLFIAYFIGSIPFGLLLSLFFGAGDIRKIGSGNIGATNVLRSGSKGLAALTLFLDAAKGAIAVIVLSSFSNDFPYMWFAHALGASAIIGHVFPFWLDFKGGKGVATILGVLLAISWETALFAILTWFLIALVFRYSSLAALVAVSIIPVYAYFKVGPEMFLLSLFLTIVVYVRHIENIKRLLQGKESKIGANKTKGL